MNRGGSDEVMGIKSLEESVKNLAMKIRAIPSPWSDSHERNTVVVSGNIIIFNGVLKIVGMYFRGK